jgi:cell division protein FtsZ
MVDDVLRQAVCSISDLIVIPGLINLDFADVKSIMGSMGKALMGSGTATGEMRASEAAQKAISSPLLDEATIDRAKGILINITGGEDLTLLEVNEASMMIQENAHEDAHIIFGAVINKEMEGEMRVTVIATGFEEAEPIRTHQRPALKKVVGGEPISEGDSSSGSFKRLKSLATTIKEGSLDTGSLTSNFDIPTFLRKHAD